jgi:predicted NAD/FAD-binding protein
MGSNGAKDHQIMKKKIAIIGSGISSLICGYKLQASHEITVFEANDYIGGHTRTVRVENDGETVDVDTGFIVFNDRTYPNFIRIMEELGVAYQPTEMSFSVRNDQIDLEYNGGTFSQLFAQKRNILRPAFYRLLLDIARFNKVVRREKNSQSHLTIGEYLDNGNYSSLFRDNYLLPMISAIWSMGLDSCRDFPLAFFARFFENHGLLDIVNRPQWFTIKGGSSTYIKPLTRGFSDRIRLGCGVVGVRRTPAGIVVQHCAGEETFDEVIFGCHGDQALQLLTEATPLEREILGAFHCSDNRVVLHTDTGQLPTRRNAWASWNYRMVDSAGETTALTYNMNILQRLNTKHTYLVTLNQEIEPQHILASCNYQHPIYTTAAITAQQRWQEISGTDHIHFCGAYWFNGFHEDGVKSGLRVCRQLEGKQ